VYVAQHASYRRLWKSCILPTQPACAAGRASLIALEQLQSHSRLDCRLLEFPSFKEHRSNQKLDWAKESEEEKGEEGKGEKKDAGSMKKERGRGKREEGRGERG
jgi:hypothetical protein